MSASETVLTSILHCIEHSQVSAGK